MASKRIPSSRKVGEGFPPFHLIDFLTIATREMTLSFN